MHQYVLKKEWKKTVELIEKWADNSKIAAIISFGSNAIREDFADSIDYQMYIPQVVRKIVKYVQIFFKVQTNQIVKQLVKKSLSFVLRII